jgi:hypothetical protein
VVDLERERHPELSKMLDIHDSNMSKSGHFCPQKKGFFHHLQGGGKMMILSRKLSKLVVPTKIVPTGS